MDRKSLIRDLVGRGDLEAAFPLLLVALKETQEDFEIHYYLGEVYTRKGDPSKALPHFQTMYALDAYGEQSILRYIQFLLRTTDFSKLQDIVDKALNLKHLSNTCRAQLHWTSATTLFSQNQRTAAKQELDKALHKDPWNISFLSLALKLHDFDLKDMNLPFTQCIASFLSKLSSSTNNFDNAFIQKWIDRAVCAMNGGYAEYAFLMGKALFTQVQSQNVKEFLTKASASFHSRIAAQHVLMLLNTEDSSIHGNLCLNLAELSVLIANIYAHSGEWPLVDEWVDIGFKSSGNSNGLRAQLFTLQALKLAVEGQQLAKAQTLIEAALDAYETPQHIPASSQILYGYILVSQGDLKNGMEKMEKYLDGDISIQNLYFLAKGSQRVGHISLHKNDVFSRLFHLKPTSPLEQKMLEEIYFNTGVHKTGEAIPLAC